MKILVISNMYPSNKFPNYGVFVKNFVELCESYDISSDKVFLNKTNSKIGKVIDYIYYFIKIFICVIFKKYKYIYVHYAGQNSIPLYFLLKIKKIPLIMNVHGSDIEPEKPIHNKLLFFTKSVLNKSTKIVVPSDYYKVLVSEKFNIDSTKIYVFPSAGIDNKIFYPLPKDKAREITGITNKKTIGFIGRIDYGKGWDTLLEAIRYLGSEINLSSNEFQFVFVGSGKEVNDFEKKVEEYKLKDYIIHVPMTEQKNLIYYYNAFDVFCFPTRRKSESLGLVAIEAMACAVPVISSDFAAPGYYIQNNKNGFKFKLNSHEDLANLILDFFRLSEEDLQTMKKNSLDTAQKYSREEIKSILYKDILI